MVSDSMMPDSLDLGFFDGIGASLVTVLVGLIWVESGWIFGLAAAAGILHASSIAYDAHPCDCGGDSDGE